MGTDESSKLQRIARSNGPCGDGGLPGLSATTHYQLIDFGEDLVVNFSDS